MHLVCSLINWMCVSPCNCFLAVQEEQAQAMFANAKQVLDQFLRKSRIQGFGCWAGCLGHRVLGLLGFWLSWCNNNVSSSTWMACISNGDFFLDMGEGRVEASDVTLFQALWTSHWLQGYFSPHYKSHCCWPICISTAISTGSHQPSSWWVALLPDIWLAISHVHHYCWVFGLDALHSPSCAAIIHYLPFLSPKKGSTQIIQLKTWKGSGKKQLLWSLTHCWFLIEGKEVLQSVCMTSSSMSQRHISLRALICIFQLFGKLSFLALFCQLWVVIWCRCALQEGYWWGSARCS